MKRKIVKNFLCALGFSAICAVVGLTVGCPIKRIFALPCPGCGITRGCLALLKLDFADAIHYHPLCFLMPLFFAAYVFKDIPTLKRLQRPWILMAVGVLFLAVYLVRMRLYFPFTEPMNIEKNSVVGEIVRLLLLH